MDQKLIETAVRQVMAALEAGAAADGRIPVGVSNRHIHLSAAHMEVLFGSGSTLTHQKDLKQVGEFAARETVTLIGPKGVIRGVRVLGPVRDFTQIELARTDGFSLGIAPPVRNSGDIAGSAGVIVAGTHGAVTLSEGVICAARHIHMTQADACRLGVADGDRVKVAFGGERGGSYDRVLIRVKPDFRLEFHIDTDEANAAGLNNGDWVTIEK
ncbi:MAG: phosphate propanoyltransferase [Sporomusaceae bacterium]|nr:phosphate propanoyltransferase [Sporomusaceae bacterium]